jgi:hypothetical protein
MRRITPTLLAVVLSACSSGASVEEATSATCRDIQRWTGELGDVLAEDKDQQATDKALTEFQQSLQADAEMFREAGKETVASRIDDWELIVGRLRSDMAGESISQRATISLAYILAGETQDAIDAVKASVICDGTAGT